MANSNSLAICIPAYNAAKFLPKLFSSIEKQKIPFDEILVYDDCSNDDTHRVAESGGAIVIRGDVNRGCSYGKNKLAEVSTCKWLHFHDADDDILDNFTQLAHKWIREAGNLHDLLLLNFNYVDFQSKEVLGSANHNKADLQKDPLRYSINNKIVNFGIYKKDSFLYAGGFDTNPSVLYNEDNAFHQRLAKKGLKFDYLETVTCINYRYQQSMSSSNALKCAQANYHVLKQTTEEYANLYPEELGRQVWNCISALSVHQDWDYVKRCLCLLEKIPYNRIKFKTLFDVLKFFHPYGAIRFREMMIRRFKPHIRKKA